MIFETRFSSSAKKNEFIHSFTSCETTFWRISVGTIDADYRGEVGIIIINHGQEAVTIAPGERIAQLIIAPVVRAEFVEMEELDATRRNAGGFGHTGG